MNCQWQTTKGCTPTPPLHPKGPLLSAADHSHLLCGTLTAFPPAGDKNKATKLMLAAAWQLLEFKK